MPEPTASDNRSRLLGLRARAEAAAAGIPRWLITATLLMLFAMAGWLATQRLELDASDVQWGWLVLAVMLGVPLTVLANAVEYRHSARAVATPVALPQAARVAVVATAANLLPLPGGAMVRIGALTRQGVRAQHAGSVTVIVGLTWIAVATVIAGAVLTPVLPIPGTLAILAGSVLGIGAFFWSRKLSGSPPSGIWFGQLAIIELGSVLASAMRLTLALAALGVGLRPMDGAVLAVSGAISNSVGIIPAGLGLKEVITAGLATILALPASLGFVVSVLDRAVGLLGHGLLAIPLLTGRRG